MRRRKRRKAVRNLLNADMWLRFNRVNWVTSEWALVSLVIVTPLFMLGGYVHSEISAQVGLGLLILAGAPLFLLTAAMGLASFNMLGVLESGWWRFLETTLDNAVQLGMPSLATDEQLLLTSIEWSAAKFIPRKGRLTLTTSRLIFQRPRYRWLPPSRAGRVIEAPLSEIVGIGVDRRFLQRFLRGGMDLLLIRFSNDSELKFKSNLASVWRRSILRARNAAG